MKEKLRKLLQEDGLTIAIVIVVVIAYSILRTPSSDLETVQEIEAAIVDGQPTVVEFYANNCSICLVSKPKVDLLERDLEQEAQVLRLNVRNEPGKTLAYDWRIAGLPTFLVLDGNGELVYRRSGAPDIPAIKEAVATLPPTD